MRIILLSMLFISGCTTIKHLPLVVEIYKCGEPIGVVLQDSKGRLEVERPHDVLGNDEKRAWLYTIIEELTKERMLARNDISNCGGI